MILTEVWVPGRARTKGSLLNNQDTPISKRWRALVAECVRKDLASRQLLGLPAIPYAGPVAVNMFVWLDVSDVTAVGSGDLDKLARNALDAIAADAKSALMNGGAIVNDSQVVSLFSAKFSVRESRDRAGVGHPQGMLLSVQTAEQVSDRAVIDWARRVRGW